MVNYKFPSVELQIEKAFFFSIARNTNIRNVLLADKSYRA